MFEGGKEYERNRAAMPNRNRIRSTYVTVNFLGAHGKSKKKQVRLILVMYFIHCNVSNILAFQPIISIKIINERIYILIFSY